MKYGYFDVVNQAWLGKNPGNKPIEIGDETLAKAGATILTERFDRLIQAKPLPETKWKFKDTVTPELSLDEAMNKIERKKHDPSQN